MMLRACFDYHVPGSRARNELKDVSNGGCLDRWKPIPFQLSSQHPSHNGSDVLNPVLHYPVFTKDLYSIITSA